MNNTYYIDENEQIKELFKKIIKNNIIDLDPLLPYIYSNHMIESESIQNQEFPISLWKQSNAKTSFRSSNTKSFVKYKNFSPQSFYPIPRQISNSINTPQKLNLKPINLSSKVPSFNKIKYGGANNKKKLIEILKEITYIKKNKIIPFDSFSIDRFWINDNEFKKYIYYLRIPKPDNAIEISYENNTFININWDNLDLYKYNKTTINDYTIIINNEIHYLNIDFLIYFTQSLKIKGLNDKCIKHLLKKLLLFIPYVFIKNNMEFLNIEMIIRNFVYKNESLSSIIYEPNKTYVHFTQMQRGTCWACAHLNAFYLIETKLGVMNIIKEQYKRIWENAKRTFDVNSFIINYYQNKNMDLGEGATTNDIFQLSKQILNLEIINIYREHDLDNENSDAIYDKLKELIELLSYPSVNLIEYCTNFLDVQHLFCIYKKDKNKIYIHDSNTSEIFENVDNYLNMNKYLNNHLFNPPDKNKYLYRKLFSFFKQGSQIICHNFFEKDQPESFTTIQQNRQIPPSMNRQNWMTSDNS